MIPIPISYFGLPDFYIIPVMMLWMIYILIKRNED